MGIIYAVLVGTGNIGWFATLGSYLPYFHEESAVGQLASAALFLTLAGIVARTALRKVE